MKVISIMIIHLILYYSLFCVEFDQIEDCTAEVMELDGDAQCGRFGSVLPIDDNNVIKKIQYKMESDLNLILNEIDILNVIKTSEHGAITAELSAYCKSPDSTINAGFIYLTLEKCCHDFFGEVQRLRNSSGPSFDSDLMKKLHELVSLLETLHSLGIYHLDLHFGNIMAANEKLKLIDFGMSLLNQNLKPGTTANYYMKRDLFTLQESFEIVYNYMGIQDSSTIEFLGNIINEIKAQRVNHEDMEITAADVKNKFEMFLQTNSANKIML